MTPCPVVAEAARLALLGFWYGVVALTSLPRCVRLWRHALVPDEDMIAAAVAEFFGGECGQDATSDAT